MLVHGFHAAVRLREHQPEVFQLLTRVPNPHQRYLVDGVDDVALLAKWRSIEFDYDGEVATV